MYYVIYIYCDYVHEYMYFARVSVNLYFYLIVDTDWSVSLSTSIGYTFFSRHHKCYVDVLLTDLDFKGLSKSCQISQFTLVIR